MQIFKAMTQQMHRKHILFSSNDFNIKIAALNCSFRSKRFFPVSRFPLLVCFCFYLYYSFVCMYARIINFIYICTNLQGLWFSLPCFCYIWISLCITYELKVHVHMCTLYNNVGCNIFKANKKRLITLGK